MKESKVRALFWSAYLILLIIIVISVVRFCQDYRTFHEAQSIYKTVTRIATQDGTTTAIDFSMLDNVNENIVAWIASAGTPIDYPVVQEEDNVYYLQHLIDDTPNPAGSIFMDAQNAGDFTDANTLIYGHHIENETSMFAELTQYKTQNYYNAHPTMQLYTLQKNMTIEIFAAHLAPADTILPIRFANAAERQQYIDDAIAKSAFQADCNIAPQDKLITLATCAYDFKNARYIVYGKLTTAS